MNANEKQKQNQEQNLVTQRKQGFFGVVTLTEHFRAPER
jgi:hypothetical protein